MSTPEAVGWGALLVMLYTYFGYPLLLTALARLRRRRAVPHDAPLPRVTVVVAAWNEEACIAEKLENTLSQGYPSELLDAIVVSDGSTDLTDAIVEGCARRTGRVRLLHTEGRQGKSVALNVGVPAAEGEIVVLTDANALFAPDAIDQLVRPFADPPIGAVSGQLHYLDAAGQGMGESAYWRYEQLVKRAESALHSLLGANGSIYAIRRELFRPLHPRDVNDFRIPYQVLLEGLQVVLEPRAVSHETTAGGLWAEYRRKVRIMARAIPMMLSLVLPTLARGRLRLAWQLVSHKLLREVQGVFFLGMLGGAAWGALLGNRPLTAFFAFQVVLYLSGIVGWVVRARPLRPLRLAAHYNMIALASIAALWLWLTGSIKPTWTPARTQPR